MNSWIPVNGSARFQLLDWLLATLLTDKRFWPRSNFELDRVSNSPLFYHWSVTWSLSAPVEIHNAQTSSSRCLTILNLQLLNLQHRMIPLCAALKFTAQFRIGLVSSRPHCPFDTLNWWVRNCLKMWDLMTSLFDSLKLPCWN